MGKSRFIVVNMQNSYILILSFHVNNCTFTFAHPSNFPKDYRTIKDKIWPWLVWFSGLSTSL